MKSTVDQIRQRFDNDVARFSNLETGQSATIDSPLCMDLVAAAAAAVTPHATDLLDIGCGAGNYTLKLLEKLATIRNTPLPIAVDVTLVDLSRPMLDKAVERITPQTTATIRPLQGDMRDLDFGTDTFDIVLAASTLHHLRTDLEWHTTFAKIHRALRPGGSFWIFDLIEQSHPAIQSLMQSRYASYLESLKGGGEEGRAYREHVFAYVAAEDTPRPLNFQLDLLKQVGFPAPEILHKNGPFAAFGAQKP